MRAYEISIASSTRADEPFAVILHSPRGREICLSAMNQAHARRVATSMAMLVQKRHPRSRIVFDTSIP